MKGKRLIYFILAGFIAGTLLLVYIQFNSSKNINTLINGNEKLLQELSTGRQLQELGKNVIAFESRIRGAVATSDTGLFRGIESQLAEIDNDLEKLQKVTDDDSSVKYIDQLDKLVRRKIAFGNEVLDSLLLAGRPVALRMIADPTSKRLADSIIMVTSLVDSTRKRHLAEVTLSMDQSGRGALRFSIILISLVLISAAGLFWYIIHTLRRQEHLIQQLNLSEKKQREAARIKENFLANMSHEIRTPLNAILGFTNLLRHKKMDEESSHYLQTIEQSGENLLAIVNDILDLSKIEAGMIRLETASFSLRNLLHAVETMFATRVAEKDLQLTSETDPVLPDILEGDPMRLTQILVNLVNNAIKFTHKGRIHIHVTQQGWRGRQLLLAISVADSGIGIESDQLDRIFERFQQAEDSVTRKYGGTGLGLSIVKDLVTLLQGSITVESRPGQGTQFSLVIPFGVAKDNDIQQTDEQQNQPAAGSLQGMEILVAEDNEINQSLIRHLLDRWGATCSFAYNGQDCIEQLRAHHFHVILMDIQMPVMDGYTASQEIRQVLKSDIPIIAMTAHAMPGEREKCISFGMNEYLSKPVREGQLYQLLTKLGKQGAAGGPPSPGSFTAVAEKYETIQLDYMREVSLGNTDYEKAVTGQFLEIIPAALAELEEAYTRQQYTLLSKLAHNMRTSVSVVGLLPVLSPVLDELEHQQQGPSSFGRLIAQLKDICGQAMEEARHFYQSL
ncbi:MAG: response regulator [Chitinophagaceae bacterium]|nr:response regulator [Chitinophagaceae bacterium]